MEILWNFKEKWDIGIFKKYNFFTKLQKKYLVEYTHSSIYGKLKYTLTSYLLTYIPCTEIYLYCNYTFVMIKLVIHVQYIN